MKHREAHGQPCPRNIRNNTGATESQFCFPRLEYPYFLQIHAVAVDRTPVVITVEQGTDRVMGAHPQQIQHGGSDGTLVNLAAVPVLSQVAPSRFQAEQEFLLAAFAEQLLAQLDGAAGVLQDVHRLRPGEFIEEPAAAGIHQHEIALHFEQVLEGAPGPREKDPASHGGQKMPLRCPANDRAPR